MELADAREYRTLVSGLGDNEAECYRAAASDDDLLAVGMGDGVRIWDLRTNQLSAFLPIGMTTSVGFANTRAGRQFFSCGPDGARAMAAAR